MNKGSGVLWAFAIFCACVAEGAPKSAPGSTPVQTSSLCGKWLPATEEGKLDAKIIDESSGLAVSRRFGKIYHVNDSGDGPYFYVTDRYGSGTRKVSIEGFKPKDVEEIALGPCPSTESGAVRTCLAIADIGDNFRRRKNIEVLFIEEKNEFSEKVKPFFRATLRYPDGARNAEAFAVLPNGDLVIVSKEGGRIENATAAQVFRIQKKELFESTSRKPAVLKRVGQIDVPALTKDKGLGGLVTAMSLTDDGRRFILLTYGKAIEFNLDLSKDALPETSGLKPGKDYEVVPVNQLWQQESVGYDTNNRDIYYSSEVVMSLFNRTPPPLMKMRCK